MSSNPIAEDRQPAIREDWVAYLHQLQDHLCTTLENEDGQARFLHEDWQRAGGGGGRTRVIQEGKVFEKGGVNTSVVEGAVTDPMRQQLQMTGDYWFAAGLSLILHPINPFVPTVHANFRYFELYDSHGQILDQWFGGGTDLTPYYLIEADARHFHRTLQQACAPYGATLYPHFKKWCDDYFVNTHRDGEARGIGGIFYDHLRPDGSLNITQLLDFSKSCGNAFLPAYLPIVQQHKHQSFTEAQQRWQQIRRGRYVEFNLLHDRGTLFGLKTNGRIESILMSLPPTVRFAYDHQPAEGSPEWELLQVCRHPRDWV